MKKEDHELNESNESASLNVAEETLDSYARILFIARKAAGSYEHTKALRTRFECKAS